VKVSAVIAGMALVVYALRLSGLYLSNAPLPNFCLRVLRRLPVAVFAALIALSLSGQRGEGSRRLLAACGAGVALWYLRRPWVGLVIGMGLLWMLRTLRE
jgi:branched-subunit amino acid transport protein